MASVLVADDSGTMRKIIIRSLNALGVKNTTTHPVKEVEAPARILMSVAASEQTVQMVEREDGTLMILIDGVNPMHLRWPARQVEACTRTYMRLIKRC